MGAAGLNVLRSRNPIERFGLVSLTFCAALARLPALGERSLWLDEFSTWHVARLPLRQSLAWEAELTPPLYQLCVRAVLAFANAAHDPAPEKLLRLPAALAGIALVPVTAALGRRLGGPLVGISAAGLVAVHPLLVEYSREARPYALLLLFCALATWSWERLVRRGHRGTAVAYVALATLAMYSHMLAGLTLAAHVAWWLPRRKQPGAARCAAALAAVGFLATPLLVRAYALRDATAAGLAWIAPPSPVDAGRVFMAISPASGALWLLAGIALAVTPILRRPGRTPKRVEILVERRREQAHRAALHGLWLATAFGGLAMISLLRPLLVVRFALPAAAPAVLLPLWAAGRQGRPWVLMLLVAGVALDLPAVLRQREAPLGLRELVNHINGYGVAETDLAVVCVWGARPAQIEYERLGLEYYRIRALPTETLLLRDGPAAPVLADPRRLWLIVFQGDPEPLLEQAGREIECFELDGYVLRALPSGPYRLIRVAPR